MPFNTCNIKISVNTLSCNYTNCLKDSLPFNKKYNNCVQDKAPFKSTYGKVFNGGSPCDLPKCIK